MKNEEIKENNQTNEITRQIFSIEVTDLPISKFVTVNML
jgi:hypothetical protein